MTTRYAVPTSPQSRLEDVIEASARLRRDLTVLPLKGAAASTLLGAVILPVIPTVRSDLFVYLSPLLLGCSITSWVCLQRARRGSTLAPQIGAAALLLTTTGGALLSPVTIGLPISAAVCAYVILAGTLSNADSSFRWFWITTAVWIATACFRSPNWPELVIFPSLLFAVITYLIQRVSTGLRDNQSEAIDALHELTQTNVQLAEERETAQQATRAKSTFLANMSHELRTPLNAIIGYGELVLEAPEEFEPNDIERVVGSGRHLLSIVNDILDMSRIEAGRLDLVVEPVDLEALSAELRELAQSLVRPGVAIVWDTPELGVVSTDGMRLRQVLLNLIGNALKFTSQGTVTVRARRTDRLRFQVIDTGCGIEPELLPLLFKPFAQGMKSGLKHQGTGLGLAITRSLVTSMGGTIDVTSEPGIGTKVAVSLPLSP